jgi:hypothetical protein
MQRVKTYPLMAFALSGFLLSAVHAQDKQAPKIVRTPAPQSVSDISTSLAPLKDPATIDQIREYLRLSGDLDSFRVRWIAALDKNRSIGAPYWPESFWTALKEEMEKTDLMPMFVTLYQHGISRALMQEVLDAYERLGATHFQGSPECFKLGDAELALATDMDKLKLAKTGEVLTKVYTIYKPEIKAARVRYQAEHPEWVDK